MAKEKSTINSTFHLFIDPFAHSAEPEVMNYLASFPCWTLWRLEYSIFRWLLFTS